MVGFGGLRPIGLWLIRSLKAGIFGGGIQRRRVRSGIDLYTTGPHTEDGLERLFVGVQGDLTTFYGITLGFIRIERQLEGGVGIHRGHRGEKAVARAGIGTGARIHQIVGDRLASLLDLHHWGADEAGVGILQAHHHRAPLRGGELGTVGHRGATGLPLVGERRVSGLPGGGEVGMTLGFRRGTQGTLIGRRGQQPVTGALRQRDGQK